MTDLKHIPLRRSFVVNFDTKDGVTMFSMEFKQAFAVETLYFRKMSNPQKISRFLRKMEEC